MMVESAGRYSAWHLRSRLVAMQPGLQLTQTKGAGHPHLAIQQRTQRAFCRPPMSLLRQPTLRTPELSLYSRQNGEIRVSHLLEVSHTPWTRRSPGLTPLTTTRSAHFHPTAVGRRTRGISVMQMARSNGITCPQHIIHQFRVHALGTAPRYLCTVEPAADLLLAIQSCQ